MRLLALASAVLFIACASDPAPPDTARPATEAADLDAVAVSAPADTVETPDRDAAPTALADWVDEPAVRPDGLRFVSQPDLRAKLHEAFGVEPGLLDRLEGDAAAYDASRVTDQGGMLAAAYRPTPSASDQRPLYLLVNMATGAVHAVLTDGGDTFHRASYDATAADLTPQAIAWMQDQAGVDIAELARLGDETVLGP